MLGRCLGEKNISDRRNSKNLDSEVLTKVHNSIIIFECDKFCYCLAGNHWRLDQLKQYVKACEEEGVQFRRGEFKLWVKDDPYWNVTGFRKKLDRALKDLDGFTLIPKVKKSKSKRMSDVHISKEQEMLLNFLSVFESDEEKYQLLISTACLLKPDLKAQMAMTSSMLEILRHLKNKRSAQSIGLKDCIIGSALGESVKRCDIEKVGNLCIRAEKINSLREKRKKILTNDLQTFINPQLYSSSRGLPDSIRNIIEKFLLDDDVSHDDPSGRRLFIEGKSIPVRVMYTCGSEDTKELFDTSEYAQEIEDHEEGIYISKNRIEEVRQDMRYVKYFDKTTSGVDVKLTKAQLNYNVLRKVIKCNHPQCFDLFPVDFKEFLKRRQCFEKLKRDEQGELIYTDKIHDCEDELCVKCTFRGFLSSADWRKRVADEEAKSSRFRVIMEDCEPMSEATLNFHTTIAEFSTILEQLTDSLEKLEFKEKQLDKDEYDFVLPGTMEKEFSLISSMADSVLELVLKSSKSFKSLNRSYHLKMRDAEELEDLVESERLCVEFHKYTNGVESINDNISLISANSTFLIKNIIEHRSMLEGTFEVEETKEEQFETIYGHIGSLRFSLQCITANINRIKKITSDMIISFPIEEKNETKKDEYETSEKNKKQKKKKNIMEITSHPFKDKAREKDPSFEFIEQELVYYHYFDKQSTPGVKKQRFSYPISVRRKVCLGQFLVLAERDFSEAKTHLIRGEYQSYCRSQQIRKGLIPPGFGWVIADFSTNVEVPNSKAITDEQWRTTPQWSLENMISEINVSDLKKNNASTRITEKATDQGNMELDFFDQIDGEELLAQQLSERDVELPILKQENPGEESIFNPTKILRRSGHLPKSVEHDLHFFSTDTKHDTHLHHLNKQDYIAWLKTQMELLGICEWTDESPGQYLCVERFKHANDDVQKHKLRFGNLCHLTWPGKGKHKIDSTGANAARKVTKNALVDLGSRVKNIGVTVPYLNAKFEFPIAKAYRSRLQSRKYFGRIKHESVSTRPPKSRYYPLQNKKQSNFTKGNQSFYAHPRVTGGMFARRSSCVSCWYCTKKHPEPLKCVNSYAGEWKFGRFKRKPEVKF